MSSLVFECSQLRSQQLNRSSSNNLRICTTATYGRKTTSYDDTCSVSGSMTTGTRISRLFRFPDICSCCFCASVCQLTYISQSVSWPWWRPMWRVLPTERTDCPSQLLLLPVLSYMRQWRDEDQDTNNAPGDRLHSKTGLSTINYFIWANFRQLCTQKKNKKTVSFRSLCPMMHY